MTLSPEQQSWLLSAIGTAIFALGVHYLKGVAANVEKACSSVALVVGRVEGLERALGKMEGKWEALQEQRAKEAAERAVLREREAAEHAVLKAQVAQNTKTIEGYHAKQNELQGQLRELFRGAKP